MHWYGTDSAGLRVMDTPCWVPGLRLADEDGQLHPGFGDGGAVGVWLGRRDLQADQVFMLFGA